jgi:DNA-binding MarR family transcriptional regulator
LPADETIALGDLDDILGLHLRRAHGAVQRHFGERFAELGLTQKQVSVLWLAGDHPGVAQTDLARTLDMDRASTMAIVHSLERRGLLERAKSAGDARRIAFRLTKAGETTLHEAKAAIAEHEAWLKDRFSTAELDQLFALLRRIHG